MDRFVSHRVLSNSVKVWVHRTNIIYNLRKKEKRCVCETEGEYRDIPINITFIYKISQINDPS